MKLELLFKCACLQVRESRDFSRVEVSRKSSILETRKQNIKKEGKQKMRHNIIFLDVDGVLNNMAYFENGENVPEIDMTAVERLARIYHD